MLNRRLPYFSVTNFRVLLQHTAVACLLLITPAFGKAIVQVPQGIGHALWDQLLQKHVNERGLVDYRAWHASKEDRAKHYKYKDYHWGLNDQPGLGKDYEHSIFKSLF